MIRVVETRSILEESHARAHRNTERGEPEDRPARAVRGTVEDTLNGLLEEEAGDLVGAERYERTAGREVYRAGHYKRKFATTSGEAAIRSPSSRG